MVRKTTAKSTPASIAAAAARAKASTEPTTATEGTQTMTDPSLPPVDPPNDGKDPNTEGAFTLTAEELQAMVNAQVEAAVAEALQGVDARVSEQVEARLAEQPAFPDSMFLPAAGSIVPEDRPPVKTRISKPAKKTGTITEHYNGGAHAPNAADAMRPTVVDADDDEDDDE